MTKGQIVKKIVKCYVYYGKVLFCGNGGSASMANHMAGELVCTFEKERMALPAISLCANQSVITAWANDHDYDDIFKRQIEAFGKPGDVLIAISTSGRSENVLRAIKEAQKRGLEVIDLPRKGSSAAKVQEYQLKLTHDIIREVENALF